MTGRGVSAVVLTKDEEAHIADCLRDLRWADEVIVIDAGSTDATRDIAARHGAKVVPREWQGFSAQRNASQEITSVGTSVRLWTASLISAIERPR